MAFYLDIKLVEDDQMIYFYFCENPYKVKFTIDISNYPGQPFPSFALHFFLPDVFLFTDNSVMFDDEDEPLNVKGNLENILLAAQDHGKKRIVVLSNTFSPLLVRFCFFVFAHAFSFR